MSQEKLEILEMLKNGKITSEEALALLREVQTEDDRPPRGPWYGGGPRPPQMPFADEDCHPQRESWQGGGPRPPQMPFADEDCRPQREPWQGGGPRPPQMPFNMDFGWLSDLRSAMEESARGIFPDAFPASLKQETFTASASFCDEPCSLVFDGKNAPIKLETYAGENIEVAASYRARGQWDPHLALSEDNHVLTLTYDEGALHMLGIHIRVPEGLRFEEVALRTKNGTVSASGVEAQRMNLATKNQAIDISRVKGGDLHFDTKNASISLDHVNADRVDARTSNSKITMRNVEAERACLVTSNSRIDVEDSDIIHLYAGTSNSPLRFERMGTQREGRVRSISAVTTNGQISLQLPCPEVKCRLRASTTTSSVTTELDDLEYQVNEKNYVEAQSKGFETAAHQLILNLQTTHFGIHLQK